MHSIATMPASRGDAKKKRTVAQASSVLPEGCSGSQARQRSGHREFALASPSDAIEPAVPSDEPASFEVAQAREQRLSTSSPSQGARMWVPRDQQEQPDLQHASG